MQMVKFPLKSNESYRYRVENYNKIYDEQLYKFDKLKLKIFILVKRKIVKKLHFKKYQIPE